MLYGHGNLPTWFVGKDVAEALGYERTTKAIQDHVDFEDKDEIPIQVSIGRMQKTPVINESGLYSLIFGSKLESAKKFKKWVTGEILPQIRKTGGYIHIEEDKKDAPIQGNLEDFKTRYQIPFSIGCCRRQNKKIILFDVAKCINLYHNIYEKFVQHFLK